MLSWVMMLDCCGLHIVVIPGTFFVSSSRGGSWRTAPFSGPSFRRSCLGRSLISMTTEYSWMREPGGATGDRWRWTSVSLDTSVWSLGSVVVVTLLVLLVFSSYGSWGRLVFLLCVTRTLRGSTCHPEIFYIVLHIFVCDWAWREVEKCACVDWTRVAQSYILFHSTKPWKLLDGMYWKESLVLWYIMAI